MYLFINVSAFLIGIKVLVAMLYIAVCIAVYNKVASYYIIVNMLYIADCSCIAAYNEIDISL